MVGLESNSLLILISSLLVNFLLPVIFFMCPISSVCLSFLGLCNIINTAYLFFLPCHIVICNSTFIYSLEFVVLFCLEKYSSFIMSNQPPSRPWFRLATLARAPQAQPPAQPQPAQTQTQPQPQPPAAPLPRAPMFRPIVPAPLAPPARAAVPPPPPVRAPPAAPPASSAPAPRVATVPPPSAASPPPRSPPASPASPAPRATVPPPSTASPPPRSPLASPASPAPRATVPPPSAASPPPRSPPASPASPAPRATVPPPSAASPLPRSPPASPAPPPPKATPATPPPSKTPQKSPPPPTTRSPTLSPPLPKEPSPMRDKRASPAKASNGFSDGFRSPNTPRSPQMKPNSVAPPSPFTLPPSQLNRSSDGGGREVKNYSPPEAQKKTVLIQQTLPKPNPNPKAFSESPSRAKPKAREGFHWKSSDEEDGGVRVITIAGENRGAIMELGYSPTTEGRKIKSDNEAELSGNERKSNKEEAKAKADLPMNAFMNSNVQGVNSSILFNSTCSHHDPGVHFSVSRKPFNYGGHHSNGDNTSPQKEKEKKITKWFST